VNDKGTLSNQARESLLGSAWVWKRARKTAPGQLIHTYDATSSQEFQFNLLHPFQPLRLSRPLPISSFHLAPKRARRLDEILPLSHTAIGSSTSTSTSSSHTGPWKGTDEEDNAQTFMHHNQRHCLIVESYITRKGFFDGKRLRCGECHTVLSRYTPPHRSLQRKDLRTIFYLTTYVAKFKHDLCPLDKRSRNSLDSTAI
jgi:hypothetical protein